MRLSGRVADAGLMARFLDGEELELAGAFSEGIYFSGPGGMVMLHDARCGLLPFGIAVRGISGRGRGLGAVRGQRASICRDGLVLHGADLYIHVDYEPAALPSACCPQLCELEQLRESLLSPLRDCGRSALLPYCAYPLPSVPKQEVHDEFARAGFESMRLLSDALGSASPGLLEQALCGLLGLGRGLTPSFDDFITGLLFTLRHAACIWGLGHPALSALGSAVSALAPLRTNCFSAAYLLAAAGGGDFSLLRGCLALRRSPSRDESIRELLGIGGSSGADMLCGAAYALGCILTLKHP